MNRSDLHAAPLVGAVLEGAYRITRLIGEGGMGAVYEAVQLRLNKRVAVKLMARELAANREALARFHREAEITSHLGHPHLVTVIDFGMVATGEPYMVMEYLNGTDLDHRIQQLGRLSLEVTVSITKHVASALAAAHGEGIVHRDLKPGNVFLVQVPGEPDFVKILDFGISKMKAARTQLTNATAVMGTPQYMSPEQVMGLLDEIDHFTDQWSLACIAWEMLSGRSPFVAEDAGALFHQILNLDPQPLGKRVPDLPRDVEPVLRRALSKPMANRYPSIKDFAQALEVAAMERPIELGAPPVILDQVTMGKETIGFGSTPAQRRCARQQPDGLDDTDFQDALRTSFGRFKPIHAIAVVGIALLVLAAVLLLRTGAKPTPTTSRASAPLPATPASAAPALSHPSITPIPTVVNPAPSVVVERMKPTAAEATAAVQKDNAMKALGGSDHTAAFAPTFQAEPGNGSARATDQFTDGTKSDVQGTGRHRPTRFEHYNNPFDRDDSRPAPTPQKPLPPDDPFERAESRPAPAPQKAIPTGDPFDREDSRPTPAPAKAMPPVIKEL